MFDLNYLKSVIFYLIGKAILIFMIALVIKGKIQGGRWAENFLNTKKNPQLPALYVHVGWKTYPGNGNGTHCYFRIF